MMMVIMKLAVLIWKEVHMVGYNISVALKSRPYKSKRCCYVFDFLLLFWYIHLFIFCCFSFSFQCYVHKYG